MEMLTHKMLEGYSHLYWKNLTQFREKVNVYQCSEIVLQMLQNTIEPLTLEILEDNPDDFGNFKITFQQDRAPAH